MRLSERDFFLNKLDTSISALADAARLYESGDIDGARKTFVSYMKSLLRPEKRYQIPEAFVDGRGDFSEEEWTEMVLEGYVYPVDYLYKFPEGKIIWDYNAMPNGYVEWVFHLQYHTEVLYLERAYRKTGDEKYAKRAAEMIESWIDQVERPERHGQATYRTLETGGRMANSWPYFIHAFANSPAVSDELWVKIFISIWEQSDWLYLSRSNRNWLIHELYGLISSCVYFPFYKDTPLWHEHALKTLIDELRVQIYPDGASTDRSFTYQRGMVTQYCDIIKLLGLYGRPVPCELVDGLYKEFIMYCHLAKPDLMLAEPNDCHFMSCVPMAKLGLSLFPDDETLKYFASERKEGKAPDKTMQVLPYSGFATLRSDWTKDGMWLFLDGAAPDYNSGWHVHECCLNVQLYAYGTDMLIDPGFYHYDTSKMREYTLATRSHNTGLVDGMGQLCFAKNDVYGFIDSSKLGRIKQATSENIDTIEAYYDFGYGKDFRADKRSGTRDASGDAYAKHTRKIVFVKKGLGDAKPFFIMLDSFETMDEKKHRYEISFQLDEVKAEPSENAVKVTYGSGATLSMISTVAPKIIIGQTEPELAGWKPELDHHKDHRPAPLVTFEQSGRDALFATVLYPSPSDETPEIVIDSFDKNKIVLIINGEKHTVEF